MKKGKEFLIKGAETQDEALGRLFEKMIEYLKVYDLQQWEWRKHPETEYHHAEWWAYARITFT